MSMSSQPGSTDHGTPAIKELPWTGERMLTSFTGNIVAEHLHRYGLVLSLCKGREVLDVACGEGYGSHLLSEQARFVTGVDIDSQVIEFAAAKYRRPNLKFLNGDGQQLPLADASVDVVVSFETIEHLPDHERFLGEIRRVLRPDGCLVISSPDRETYRLEAGKNPWHVREVDRQELESSLRRCFQNISFAAQRMCHGSLVVPDSGDCFRNGFTTLDGNFLGIRQSAGLPQPTYWVAVASNSSPLPELPWGLFDSPLPVDDPVHEIAQLRKQIHELEQSTSWKLTAPVRWLSNTLRKIRRPQGS